MLNQNEPKTHKAFSGVLKPATFNDCLNQYTPLIKSIIKKLRIYKDYDEYYQIGQIALWHAYENYEINKGSFSNYAYLNINGYLLNALSKESKYDDRNVVVGEHKEEKTVTNEALLYEEFISNLEGISPLQMQILIDRFYYNREFSQIAAKLNMPESSVRSSYRYALKRLREQA
jgi:RNA polymerase sigma factor (sigma-70 family)